MAETDQALLLEYLGGDCAAFARLLERHAGMVYGVALRRACDPESAKDVVQEVFILLARKARNLLVHPSVAAWLHRTAQNVSRDSKRAEQRYQSKITRFAQEARVPGVGFTDASVLEVIEKAVTKLPAHEKEAVILRYYEDLDYDEISQQLGISPPAVRKRISRAVVRLQGVLGRHRIALTTGLAALFTQAPQRLTASVLPTIPVGKLPLQSSTLVLLMTKSTVIKLGLALLVGGFLFTQWNTNQKLKTDLQEARNQISQLALPSPTSVKLERSKGAEESDPGKAAVQGSSLARFQKEIDLTGAQTTQEKIDRILEELSRWEGYFTPNPAVRQLVALGPEAVEPLLAHLTKTERWNAPDDGNAAGRAATEDALEQLLTRDDKEKILSAYLDKGYLGKLISKFQFTEARDAVIDKIQSGENVKRSDIAVAITLDPDAAIPLAQEYATNLESPAEIYEVAKELDSVPNADLGPLLTHAIQLPYELPEGLPEVYALQLKSGLARLAIENGVADAIPLAAEILRHPETNDYDRRKLAAAVRKATNAFGGEDTIPDWLDENHESFTWDPQQRMFLLDTGTSFEGE